MNNTFFAIFNFLLKIGHFECYDEQKRKQERLRKKLTRNEEYKRRMKEQKMSKEKKKERKETRKEKYYSSILSLLALDSPLVLR